MTRSQTKLSAISALPDAPRHLALSDLALEAAIELERYEHRRQGNLEAVRQLAATLSERGFADLSLVPVYDRALAVGGTGSGSRTDLLSRLEEITGKLGAAPEQDIALLRDFCVALHDALLTSRIQSLRPPPQGLRRFL